jgi:galacturan 1,4-alpha-galacturonidase
MRNFEGVTSKKYDPLVGTLVCSSPSVCGNITISDVNIKSPSGTSLYECGNIEGIDDQVECRKK